jgi:Protein of unknown function (DUF2934)
MDELNKAASSSIIQTSFTLRDPETNPKAQHTHTLNEVQRRAYQIHQRYGGIYGGYTLEDWLEAEHELDEEDNSPMPKKDQIH